jgi:tetratricopeptide (TPR) repeat protein
LYNLKVRAAVRLALSLALGVGGGLVAGELGARRGLAVLIGAIVTLAPTLFLVVVPRLAHRAFERGELRRALLWYRVLLATVLERRTRAALRVSRVACLLAGEDLAGALEALGEVDRRELDEAGRATWHNNRAYALARAGRLDALDGALGDIDEALRLRPGVAGFHHTRGVVLLALGRPDDAIRELERMWSEDAPVLLEAERCLDLGIAWLRKGEIDYGRDYLTRAARTAPKGHWVRRRASEKMPPSPGGGSLAA